MKYLNKYIDNISFEEAASKIEKEKIDYLIKGDQNAKYSISLKKILVLLVGLFMPIMILISYNTNKVSIETTFFSRSLINVISIVFIVLLLLKYFKSSFMFKYYGYKDFSYFSFKILFLSYICGSLGTVDSDYITNLITIGIYIPVCLYLYYLVEKNLLVEYINLIFGKNYKVSKIFPILLKITGVIVTLGIAIVQLYRLNKSWLDTNLIDETVSDWEVNMTVIIVMGIFFMLIISLIPIYFGLKKELVVQNSLVMKYSEEFREMYEYSKKEWHEK